MCSLAGVYWFGADCPECESLVGMAENALTCLRNRGPDESASVKIRDNLVMAGNRLIIRGNFGEGSMPFKYKQNLMFYNGEIYNFRNWNKNASSDGEVILPLYDEFEVKAFSKLDGEFAISIWDERKETLLLIRDPFGTKPIYFSLDNRRLLWASSASAINDMERHDFCAAVQGPCYKHTLSVQEPYTSYKGIWLLPPGHFLLANDSGVKLLCYKQWDEYSAASEDVTRLFGSLEKSLESRMDYTETIGIPMSAGIDSGIIANMADKLKVKYHIFSVIEIFGEKTPETDAILKRINRLKNVSSVTLLKCNEEQYWDALSEIFLPGYYDSEKFDNGSILTHTVFKAMKKENIRVAIDGTGGDELFHGYPFRDNFRPVDGWPQPWKANNFFYSMFTTLLDYTSKADRAGAFFSIETRFPYQAMGIMKEALKLKYSATLKWPLRKFLIERLDYGEPTEIDLSKKFGFHITTKSQAVILIDMMRAWCRANKLSSLPTNPPTTFPFRIGLTT